MVSADASAARAAGRAVLATLGVALWLSGCAGGVPVARTQAISEPGASGPGAAAHDGTAAQPAQDEAGGHAWWEAFGSPKLGRLIDEALQASPTVAAAQATLQRANETYAAHAGSTRYPRLAAVLGARRQRTAAGGAAPDTPGESSLFSAGLEVQYRLDLSGANEHALRALAARADHQRFELLASRLTLASRIAHNAVAQARLQAQSEALQAVLDGQEQQVQLARQRQRLGHAGVAEVLALQSAAEQTRASIALLNKELQHSRFLMAVLAGRPPDAELAPFTLDDFRPDTETPSVVPSQLTRRRPDIQAALALVRAADADHGAAAAKLYPRIDLSASIGTQALTSGALFSGPAAVWSLLGQLTQPLFDAGLPAEKRAARAALGAAVSNYQAVVLEALRDVASALSALHDDAQALTALGTAHSTALGALEVTRRQHAHGTATYHELLAAQQQAQRLQVELIGAQARWLADAIALHQAIGG
ncbi:MAG: efflux transporter outer membrane subunit [Pseudomonadota bacterium]